MELIIKKSLSQSVFFPKQPEHILNRIGRFSPGLKIGMILPTKEEWLIGNPADSSLASAGYVCRCKQDNHGLKCYTWIETFVMLSHIYTLSLNTTIKATNLSTLS